MTYQPLLEDTLLSPDRVPFQLSHSIGTHDPHGENVDPAHIHACYELYVNCSGDMSFLHGNKVSRIESGDIVFSRPGDVHYCIYHGCGSHEHYCLWFEDSEAGLIARFVEKHDLSGHLRLRQEKRTELFSLLSGLEESHTDPLIRSACFLRLLSLLCQRKQQDRGESVVPQRISEILTYIDHHLTSIRTTGELAEAFFLSESTLNRLFRTHVHLSVHQLIEAKRLSLSERLLREGYSVTEACFASGFTDLSRFISRFRAKFGLTPLKYKAALTTKESP